LSDKPERSAENIMQEVREGLADMDLATERRAALEKASRSSFGMQKAHAHASVMGRCEGSLRGKLCKFVSPLALPVIEQLDIFHSSMLQIMTEMQERITNLEGQVRKLEQDADKQEQA
jgi:hypothetical protein